MLIVYSPKSILHCPKSSVHYPIHLTIIIYHYLYKIHDTILFCFFVKGFHVFRYADAKENSRETKSDY